VLLLVCRLILYRYTSSDNNQNLIERLQREVAELRDQLQASSRATGRLSDEVEAVSELPVTSARRRKTPRTMDQPTSNSALSPAVSLSVESEKLDPKHSTYIIRHMGRLVTDDSNIGRFAGSTTGVHFVSSVEEVCRRISPSIEPFHEDCFRLHLLQPRLRFDISGFGLKSVALPGADDAFLHHLQTLLAQPLESHARRLDTFLETWLAFCPVIPRQWFLRCIEQMPGFDGESSDQWQHGRACATLHTLLLIGLINKISGHHTLEDEALQIWDDPQFFGFIHQLQGPIIAHGDAWCLQSLIIFSFFLQITGRTARMIQINGTLVRLAQSLGMHRHTRRFRFGQSENELRNRMWWWVYGFDK
jgi:Fungal specific transcription factor domain